MPRHAFSFSRAFVPLFQIPRSLQRHDARNIVDRMPSMVTCSKLSPRGLWMHSNRPKEGLRSVHKGSLGGASRSSYQEGWLHISVPSIESTSSTRGGGMGGSGIQVGKVYELRRIFSQHDVDEFARMSGDLNPMHKADSEVAFSSIFKGPVVHGMLVGSLFAALIGTSVPGSIYRSQDFKFTTPVYPGEMVIARVEVLSIRSGQAGSMRLTKMRTWCSKESSTKGEEVIVIDGKALCMIPALS